MTGSVSKGINHYSLIIFPLTSLLLSSRSIACRVMRLHVHAVTRTP